jgi:hypothetical protein
MARFAVVQFSELGDRWDAGFHITRGEHKARTAELVAAVTAEDCIARIAKLDFEDKKPLAVLMRGSQTYLTNEKLMHAAKQYPHLSLAILEATLPAMKARAQAEVVKAMAVLDAIDLLVEPSAAVGNENAPAEAPRVEAPRAQPPEQQRFQAGWCYPLLEKGLHDDDFGAGFDFVAVPHDTDVPGLHIQDCWLVNAQGEVHPGYGSNPIPISIAAVDIAAGKPFEGALPVPKSIFDSPWFKR